MRLRPILEGAVVVVFALLIWNNFALRRQQAVMARAAVQSRGFVPKDEIGDVSMVDLSGAPARLRLAQGRHMVAVVDPRCESCRELVATLRPTADLVVVSVAPPELTRTMATQSGLAAVTHSLGQRSASPWRIYPQVFVVDGGRVVRTCSTVAECR